jgi:hypothetical protein
MDTSKSFLVTFHYPDGSKLDATVEAPDARQAWQKCQEREGVFGHITETERLIIIRDFGWMVDVRPSPPEPRMDPITLTEIVASGAILRADND